MKKILSKTKTFATNNKWWSTLIIIILIIILFIVFGGKKATFAETVLVEKHNITEEVSTTGNVKPLSDLDLSFETSGKVIAVYANVGDRVYVGQALIKLDQTELSANFSQAEANLSAEQSRLSEIIRGARPEELNIAKSSLDDTTATLKNKITDAYTKADDAIRNNIDQIFDNPRTPSVKLNISVNNQQLENDIISLRYEIELILNNWNIKGTSLSLQIAYANLDKIKLFLDKVAFGTNALQTNSNISQTLIDKYKTAVSSARSSIDLAYSNLSISEISFNSAKYNYDLKLAGNTPETISAQEARVAQMQAQVDSTKAQLTKKVIYSPINGLVVKQNAKVGEIATPNTIIVSVISYGEYEVESFIPEADIAKIKIGNIAKTTLDAYGSDTFFETSVVKIDPAETVIENVPTYKVTLKFASTSDSRIKSGMTANLDILTGQRNNVLSVPSRSVYTIDSKKYVKILSGDDLKIITETKVEVGMRGNDGYVEIVSGLKDGDKILSSPNL